jgi:hypothetical protein
MKRTALLVLPLALGGCYTQTHITRTVKHMDGSTEVYENKSTGYNYNPNFTGHYGSYSDQSATFTGFPPPDPSAQPQPSSFQTAPGAFGQYAIR